MVLWEYNDSFDKQWSSGGAVHHLQLRQTLSTTFRCSLTFGFLLFRFVIHRPFVTWYANILMIVTQRFDWDWRLFCFLVRFDYHRYNEVHSYDAESAFPWHHFVQSLNQKGPLTTTTVYFPVLVRVDSSARILLRDKHLPGVVTETCGACWLFRSPLGQRNPKPTWNTGHVFSASEKQSIFLVEIALEVVAAIYWKAKCPAITSDHRIVVRLPW